MSFSTTNTNNNVDTKDVPSANHERKPPASTYTSQTVSWGNTMGKLYLGDGGVGDATIGNGDGKEVGGEEPASGNEGDGGDDGGKDANANDKPRGARNDESPGCQRVLLVGDG